MTLDIIRFCQDHNIDYALRGKQVSQGWIGLPDVWNKINDTEYHLGFNLAGSYLYSWIDGWHSIYDWLDLVAPYENKHDIMVEYGDEVSFVNRLNDEPHNATEIEFNFPELPRQAQDYIRKRNFDPHDLIRKYNLRWGGIVGSFAFRIIIPIYDKEGNLVSYQGRFIGTDKNIPRYKTLAKELSIIDPKHVLYNENNVRGNIIYLVEGFFNVARWGANTVASLGTSFTEAQVRALAQYDRVVILFDSEVQAQQRANKLAERVSSMGVHVDNVDLELVGRDIAQCSDIEIQQFRRQIG